MKSSKSNVLQRLKHKLRTVNTLWKLGSGKKKQPLPANWISTLDERTKREFYYNTATGESTWVRPKESSGAAEDDNDNAVQKVAVFLVNVQKDFFPNGAFPVPKATKILGPIKQLSQLDNISTFHICLQRPANHASFFKNNPGSIFLSKVHGIEQDMYVVPEHCVEGTAGAAIHNSLQMQENVIAVDVGGSPLVDDFSPFAAIDEVIPLEDILRAQKISKIFVLGIGLETAVQAVALDAQLYSDADVFVVIDGVAELGAKWSYPAAADQAQKRLQSANVAIIDSHDALDIIRDTHRSNLRSRARRRQQNKEEPHGVASPKVAPTKAPDSGTFRTLAEDISPLTGQSRVHKAIVDCNLGTLHGMVQ